MFRAPAFTLCHSPRAVRWRVGCTGHRWWTPTDNTRWQRHRPARSDVRPIACTAVNHSETPPSRHPHHPQSSEALDRGYHVPVLLDAVLEAFAHRPLLRLVDGTVGTGGHALALLQAHPELECLVGIDRDAAALHIARQRLQAHLQAGGRPSMVRTALLHGNYVDMPVLAAANGISQASGVLLDLGVSSLQLDSAERGFSFGGSVVARDRARTDPNALAPWQAPLDMRMDVSHDLTAADIVNGWPESELLRILVEYGEERQASRIVQRIAEVRRRQSIRTTGELAALILEAKQVVRGRRRQRRPTAAPGGDTPSTTATPLVVPDDVGVWYRGRRNTDRSRPVHPATLTFQALRIAVNRELELLPSALQAGARTLEVGGRLVVISFHRLEDRIVKWAFRRAAALAPAATAQVDDLAPWRADSGLWRRRATPPPPADIAHIEALLRRSRAAAKSSDEEEAEQAAAAPASAFTVVTKKPVVPDENEREANPRCRSAKLRILERTQPDV
ncbi:hypothetical protein CDCA_CDCA17G4425 [Cyanidium caldarium]|uniref:Uncharacterized protein n=1 Tax=Cyanidium caldarium TaxID=2771 RepID=A0AAV9J1D4_CYACA|nr:hypothetical protein CDCA_CDCA17G4425 [Cyanidium caldarium]